MMRDLSIRPWAHVFIRLGQLILVGLIAYFWGRALWANWAELQGYRWEVRPGPLVASLVVLLVHLALVALIWWWSLRFFGQPSGWRAAVQVWLVAQIARYLPGGVWDTVGRVYLGGQAGLSRARTGLSVAVEMVTQAIAAAVVFLVSLLFWPKPVRLPSLANLQIQTDHWMLMIGGLVLLGLLMLYPPVLETVLNTGLRVLGRSAVRLPLRYRDVLTLTVCHVGARCVVGTGFYLFTSAIFPLSVVLLPVTIGIFSIAWLVGFVIVFVPMGLGVREGVIAALLVAFVPLPVAAGTALGFRVWISLRDLIGAAAGLLLRR